MRTALKGSLATLDRETGHPYASLVLVATEPDGAPIFLISRLALHTRNLREGPARQPADRRHRWPGRSPHRRAVDADGRGAAERQPDGAAPLPGPASERRRLCRLCRFLDLHARGRGRRTSSAALAASSISPPAALLTDTADAARADRSRGGHHRAYEQRSRGCGRALCNRACPALRPGTGACAASIPTACDLLHCTNAVRIEFPERVRSPGEARQALVALVQQARARQQARA